MLQTYGQYNVGVLFVRFIQLYSLSIMDPIKYNYVLKAELIHNSRRGFIQCIEIRLYNRENAAITVDDLPQTVRICPKLERDANIIYVISIMSWNYGNYINKVGSIKLKEDSCVIFVYFPDNTNTVVKSSDGRVKYL